MEDNKEFEKWLKTVCFQKPTKEAYDLAKESWTASLAVANERCAVIAWGEGMDLSRAGCGTFYDAKDTGSKIAEKIRSQVPMANPFQSVAHLIAKDMVAKKDSIIAGAIDYKLGKENWELAELVGRGELTVDSNGYEVFIFDSEDLVVFGPVVFGDNQETNTMSANQSYNLLYTQR